MQLTAKDFVLGFWPPDEPDGNRHLEIPQDFGQALAAVAVSRPGCLGGGLAVGEDGGRVARRAVDTDRVHIEGQGFILGNAYDRDGKPVLSSVFNMNIEHRDNKP